MKARIMLKGVALAAPPDQQGDLDGLCGLYAAINAIAVVMAPIRLFSAADRAELMTTGTKYLAKRGQLITAITSGMTPAVQYRLTCKLAKEAGRLSGTAWEVTRPARTQTSFDRGELLRTLDLGLTAGAALVVCLENALDHYSVIIGRSAARYYLHDSSGLRWIARRSLGAQRDAARHQIRRNGIVQIVQKGRT